MGHYRYYTPNMHERERGASPQAPVDLAHDFLNNLGAGMAARQA